MAGLDNAASAFETDINGTSSRAADDGDSTTAEPMFMREHEGDVAAGGDGEPDPEPPRARRQQRQQRQQTEDDGGDDADAPLDPLDAEDPDDPDVEDEGDDPDVEDEDDSDEDDSDDGEFDTMEFEVLVDGEPAKVTGKEMKDGYIRTRTFHQRLNKLNEAGEAMRREADILVNDRRTYIEKLREAEELLTELTPKEPDWDKLFDEEPKKAHLLRKQYDELAKKREALVQKRREAEQAHEQAQTVEYKKWVAREAQKVAADNPEWADPKRKQREVQSMVKTARSAGFSDDEIVNTHDSRMIRILKKAAAFDRIMAARTNVKPVRRGKTPGNPGAGSRRTAPKGLNRATQKLQRTGSLEAAADVFAEVLKR